MISSTMNYKVTTTTTKAAYFQKGLKGLSKGHHPHTMGKILVDWHKKGLIWTEPRCHILTTGKTYLAFKEKHHRAKGRLNPSKEGSQCLSDWEKCVYIFAGHNMPNDKVNVTIKQIEKEHIHTRVWGTAPCSKSPANFAAMLLLPI